MEGEMKNFAFVWTTVVACLLFCRKISKVIAPGTTRFFAFIPVFCIFFYLPLRLTAVHLTGTTSFFITWLANFKLLLFAFDKGPLFTNPPLPLSKFILTACVPIKISEKSKNEKKSTQVNGKSSSESAKSDESGRRSEVYEYGDQDFWGERWNLMVTAFATFIVSGLMHELIFYYLGRLKPTACLELVVKRAVGGRFRLPAVVSGPLALGLVIVSSFWLFFPPFWRCDTEIRSCKEFVDDLLGQMTFLALTFEAKHEFTDTRLRA